MSQAATYRYGNKNNWRRWAWNRIAEHCPVPKSEARVLYMPGPEDNDRDLARRHGFKDWNLIGVDTCPALIASHRAAGKIIIRGDVHHVLGVDFGFSFDACMVDLLGDFNFGTVLALTNLERPHVAVVNMLRGRTGEIRNKPWYREIRAIPTADPAYQKHRAGILNASIEAFVTSRARDCGVVGEGEAATNNIRAFAATIPSPQRPNLQSYRAQNGRTLFDSAVFVKHHPGRPWEPTGEAGADWRTLRRQIAAAKALSTMQRRPTN